MSLTWKPVLRYRAMRLTEDGLIKPATTSFDQKAYPRDTLEEALADQAYFRANVILTVIETVPVEDADG